MPSPRRAKRSNCAGRSSPRLPAVMRTGGPAGVQGSGPIVCSSSVDAGAAPRHRLAAPEHPPDLDVLLEPARPAPVVHSAGGPLALGGGQAPPDAEPQHDAPARDLIQVADLVSQDHGLAKRRQQDRGAQAHALRHGRDVGEGRQRLEPRLGHDAVADPDGVVARAVAVPRHLPALLHGRPPGRVHDDGARREEDADAHGSGPRHRYTRSRGSRRSRIPSPSRLAPITASRIATPGNVAIHQ